MKKILFTTLGLCILSNTSVTIAANIFVGAKIGGNYSFGRYEEKADDIPGGYAQATLNKPRDFSGTESAAHFAVDIFSTMNVFEDDRVFIDGELSITAFGPRFTSKTNAFERSGEDDDLRNDIDVRERFSATLSANIGKEVVDNFRIYGKLGVKIASVNIKQTYDPVIEADNIAAVENKKTVGLPGIIVGLGIDRHLTEKVRFQIETTYTFTLKKKLSDFSAFYDDGNNQNDINFTNRKISLDHAAIKLGLSFKI